MGRTAIAVINAATGFPRSAPSRTTRARQFESFAKDHDVRGATLVLDSQGGSVLGALALGRAIRNFDITTAVGKLIEAKDGSGTMSFRPDAACESMCAFVLLGGTHRYVPAEARIRVHQIWLGNKRSRAAELSYSAEELVLVQRDIGRLAQYTIEMGGGIELIETSLRIPPWEPLYALSADELRRMRLSTVDRLFETEQQHERSVSVAAPRPGASFGTARRCCPMPPTRGSRAQNDGVLLGSAA